MIEVETKQRLIELIFAMEFISTLHFLHREQRIIKRSDAPLKKRVVRRFKEAKKDKFDEELIQKAYDAIKEIGLLVA
ncbi:MAG: hypothetical protein JRG73_20110 [Deltaproteobacteria bacterium]|nr:hypothetical protein [Deltaproteobacteria bacterium]MBW2309233.1 hypothetical protein [Deltaproteobacteria bacterium]